MVVEGAYRGPCFNGRVHAFKFTSVLVLWASLVACSNPQGRTAPEPGVTSDSGVVDADVLDAAGPDVPAQPDLSVSDIADVQPSDIPTVEISDVPEVGSPDIAEIEIPDVPEVQTPDTSEVQSPDTADVAVVPPGPCCEPHQGTGCEIPTCQLMVCTLDSYCCETQWDEFCTACAGGGATLGGESCAGLFEACGCQPPPPPTAFELAEHWAPVWYHDTDDSEPTADYITAFDFDGNTASNDNWQGLVEAGSDLSAVIYWSFIETPTHWFMVHHLRRLPSARLDGSVHVTFCRAVPRKRHGGRDGGRPARRHGLWDV
jgi:hypothetical protein